METGAGNTAPIISFGDFGFKYRSQASPTLFNICLDIKEGEKVLIIGPSGSGKSTLSSCINGLIPFNYTGEIDGLLTVGGGETQKMSIFELSQLVGTVLQDPDGQFVGLTAGEDIAFSLENDRVPQDEMKQRVLKAAKTVSIENHLEVSPYDLSGGQKQRVSMAGVIINDVKVLLFDEPLANLDPAAGKQTIELIDHLVKNQSASTVVIIEHRLEDVLHKEVSRVILINEGKILADMSADDLLCTELLKQNGIREPLYITALKYAGVEVTPDKKPALITTLALTDEDKDKVCTWYKTTNPPVIENSNEELLRVEGLGFAYPETDKQVLSDVSFTINKGEMTAIVGTNGAGKSTLAKLICGFEKNTSGSVYLEGADIKDMTISERAEHIGYVMQNPNQMISKTMIYDEVALGLRSRGVDEAEVAERVEEALEVCGLKPFRSWPISALSFGQKKRVTIASVLVMRPEVIILDEPTAGQDFRHYNEIMEFLRGLNKSGVTVLMITHDMHLMLEYAPRALVFSRGRMLADSTAAKVLTDEELIEEASLKETSLFDLAKLCGVSDPADFVQHFIDYDREVRENA